MTEHVVLVERDMDTPEVGTAFAGNYAVFSKRCPDKETPNEDVAAVLAARSDAGLLVVCDGAGGTPSGGDAARLAAQGLKAAVAANGTSDDGLRAAVLDGIESGDRTIRDLGVGAGTTCAVVEIDGSRVRTYHVGDTMILVVGQRGRIKLKTVSHSPVGFAVESGMIGEDEAVLHDDRHLVSNLMGTPGMSIEIGSSIRLSRFDTVLVGSDGLFDNLYLTEIVEIIRCGPLGRAAATLAEQSLLRMTKEIGDEPSKPDDLSFVLFRRGG